MKRLLATLLCSLLPVAASAQIIPIKTVPVAQGDQFMLFPSNNRGMGGVSVALEDPLHDPFVNPAAATSISSMVIATPAHYSFTGGGWMGEASGRTLPAGLLVRSEGLFGGGMMAWQELIQPDRSRTIFDRAFTTSVPNRLSGSGSNLYGFGLAGLQIPGSRWSAGVSVFTADINALEGIRHLYQNSRRVAQEGDLQYYRAGLYYEEESGRTAEFVLLHHRTDLTHTMMRGGGWGVTRRHEEYDRTYGWAARVGYRQPLDGDWRLAGRLTADVKRHPKIPNYDLMQIPRDPGTSSAFRLGVGLSRTWGRTVFGVDLVYEPVWSHTWATALEDRGTFHGGTIPAGGMTVENYFRFNNAILRVGLRRSAEWFDLSLGLNMRRYSYHLDQEDFVEASERTQDESWIEWRPSLGLSADAGEFRLRYLGQVTLGVGRPGIANTERFSADAGYTILLAPRGPLMLQETMPVTHQVSIIVPIR